MKKANWLIFIVMLLVSCLDDPECFNLENDIIGFTYKVMGSGANDNLAFTGIKVNQNDTVIFNPEFSGPTFAMPLDFLSDSMTMFFEGLNDTVRLRYTVQPQFVDEDCGPRFVLSGLNIVDHTFDSMRVIQSTPGSNAQARNIEIYRCPVIQNTVINFYQLYSRARASDKTNFSFAGITSEFDQGIHYEGQSLNAVTLPVNIQDTLTRYIFNDGTTARELVLNYELMTHTRYRPCGEQTFVRHITAGSHSFDSVSVARNADGFRQDSITDPPTVNINIYRCPITNMVQMAFRKPAPTGTGTVANPVSLVSITTDYSDDVLYQNAENRSTVDLPLNPASDTTTFVFTYAGDTTRVETIQLLYRRRDHILFQACGTQTVYAALREAVDLPNVTVLPTDSVTYPVVTNLEILP